MNKKRSALEKLSQRILILERDRDRLATVLSITRQALQNVAAASGYSSNLYIAVGTATRSSKDGATLNIHSSAAGLFPVRALEYMLENPLTTVKA